MCIECGGIFIGGLGMSDILPRTYAVAAMNATTTVPIEAQNVVANPTIKGILLASTIPDASNTININGKNKAAHAIMRC